MNDRLNPVWHKMFYSCTHVGTVGIKGLQFCLDTVLRYCAEEDYLHQNSTTVLLLSASQLLTFLAQNDLVTEIRKH